MEKGSRNYGEEPALQKSDNVEAEKREVSVSEQIFVGVGCH